MVAMVFIGIVTAAMLRNTGSQAVATMAYGTVATANSTVASAIVATESFFSRQHPDTILKRLESVYNCGNTPNAKSIFKDRINLAPRQTFDSKLTKVFKDGDRFFAEFELDGGPRARFRRASAFYEVTNIKVKVGDWPGRDALHVGGKINNSDADFHVKGNATFSGPTNHFNSSSAPIFELDDQGRGDVYFHGSTTFDNLAAARFKTKTYFNDSVKIDGGDGKMHDSLFQNKVGFNKNLHLDGNNSGLRFNDDVWINGDLFGNDNRNWAHVGTRDASTIHYTDKLTVASDIIDKSTNDDNDIVWNNREDATVNIMQEMGMPPRTPEPTIELPSPDKFLDIEHVFGQNGNFNSKKLEDFIKAARADTTYKNNFHDGHLLINWNKNMNMGTDNEDGAMHLFNEKVMFNVTVDQPINGRFYNSNPDKLDAAGNVIERSNASTLFCLTTGSVTGFGVRGDDDNPAHFRGLIYIPESNTKDQLFANWRANSVIDGAVILKGTGNLQWNAGNGRTTIQRNDDVLSAFASLVPGGPSTTCNIVLKNPAEPINLIKHGSYNH